MNTETRNEKINAIRENIGKVLVGKEKLTDLILTAIIAEGHILLEDVPGSGKTVMAKSLARSIDAEFSRIQFTPDLLPSDVTGLNYYNQKEANLHSGKVLYSATFFWQTKSTVRHQEPSPRFWNVWKSVR